jgi:hypothetical protein
LFAQASRAQWNVLSSWNRCVYSNPVLCSAAAQDASMTISRIISVCLWVAGAVGASGFPALAQQSPPPSGIYACFGRNGPAFPAMFGIVDGKIYETYDGAQGEYEFDDSTGMITMVTGPMAGMRYARVNPSGEPWTENGWRLLGDDGELTAYVCPHQQGDPTKHPW